MTSEQEFRSVVEPVEFRSDAGKLTASGVAMRYGAKSKLIGGQFREQFTPGSLAKTIGEQDIRSHLEHGGPYLARSTNQSLRLIDSRSELAYELTLPDTSAGRDAAALLERQDIRGSSIGFRALPKGDEWTVDDDDVALRTVNEARLFVVDLTVSPAYDDSTAALALRSLATEHEMDVSSVLEVAKRGELAHLISDGGDDTPDDEDQSRETPTLVRPHVGWVYA
jgi:hypothetical protein